MLWGKAPPNQNQKILPMDRPRPLSSGPSPLSGEVRQDFLLFGSRLTARRGRENATADLGVRGFDSCPSVCPDCKCLYPWPASSLLSPLPQRSSYHLHPPPCSPPPSPYAPGGLNDNHMFRIFDCGGWEPEGLFGKRYSVKAVFIYTRACVFLLCIIICFFMHRHLEPSFLPLVKSQPGRGCVWVGGGWEMAALLSLTQGPLSPEHLRSLCQMSHAVALTERTHFSEGTWGDEVQPC